jgi:FMN-dependent NADH-azoreductase
VLPARRGTRFGAPSTGSPRPTPTSSRSRCGNAGVPYILKQLVDVVSQPGMVFAFDPDRGYSGLLTGRRAVVAYTSAVYGVGRPSSFGSDFQSTFLEDWLNWSGITDVTGVEFRPNLAVADADRRRMEAHRRATELGRTYLRERTAA